MDPSPRPEADPVASRIRTERKRLGLTLADLARGARNALGTADPARRSASVSTSYLCLIERGHKVPDEPIAVAIARALGDDEALYRAWVRARKRSDLPSALAAAETLRRMLAADGRSSGPERSASSRRSAPADPSALLLERSASSDRPAGSPARLRLPVIAEGLDPGEGVRPSCEVLEWLRLDPERLAPDLRERLDRPFATRLSSSGARRTVPLLRPGDYAIVLRDFMPLRTDSIYAVRDAGRVTLSRVLWNGAHLVALPAEGESDFLLLEARGPDSLRAHVLGIAIPGRLDPATSHAAS